MSVYSLQGITNVRLKNEGITRTEYAAYDQFNECDVTIVVRKDPRSVTIEYSNECEVQLEVGERGYSL